MMSGAYEGGLRGSGGSMSVGGSSGDHDCLRRDDAPRSICNTHGSMFILITSRFHDFTNSRIHDFTISRFHDFRTNSRLSHDFTTFSRFHDFCMSSYEEFHEFTTFSRIHDFFMISRLSHEFTNSRIHEFTNSRFHDFMISFNATKISQFQSTISLNTHANGQTSSHSRDVLHPTHEHGILG